MDRTGSRTSPTRRTPGQPAPERRAAPRRRQGHDAHRGHRQGRQRLRQHAERRLDPGAVILGNTGIGMSVRGEQFWLDKTRAAQLRPRSRPRYTLTPSIVLRNGEPFMALGTPGGDNQEQTILQAFLEHRRVLARLVSEPARGVRVAARADAALLRIVLAAPGGLQQAERRVRRSRTPCSRSCRRAATTSARSRRSACQLRDGGDDRSGDRQPHRGRRSAPRLLRDGV